MKKPFYMIEIYTGQKIVFTLCNLKKWIKDEVGDLEPVVTQKYNITVVWLTDKEYRHLIVANI